MKTIKQPVNSHFITLWWFPLFVAAVVAVGTPLVVVPKVKNIFEADRELKRIEADVEKAENKLAQLERVDEVQIAQLHTSFTQALPAQNPYYPVLLLLQQLGAETGVILGDYELKPGLLASESAQKKSGQLGYETLDTDLGLQGTTEQVSSFVEKLHASLPLLMVSNISIGDGGSEAEEYRQVQLELQILYRPNPESSDAKLTVNLEPLPPLSGNIEEVSQALTSYYNPEAQVDLMVDPLPGYWKQDLFNY